MPLEHSQMEMLIGFGPPVNSPDAFELLRAQPSGCIRMEVDLGDKFTQREIEQVLVKGEMAVSRGGKA